MLQTLREDKFGRKKYSDVLLHQWLTKTYATFNGQVTLFRRPFSFSFVLHLTGKYIYQIQRMDLKMTIPRGRVQKCSIGSFPFWCYFPDLKSSFFPLHSTVTLENIHVWCWCCFCKQILMVHTIFPPKGGRIWRAAPWSIDPLNTVECNRPEVVTALFYHKLI